MKVALRSVRRAVHRQLEIDRPERKGLSATNWLLVLAILLSLVLYTAETEHEFRTSQEGVFGFLNDIVLWIFGVEFFLRLWSAGVERRFSGARGLWAYVAANPFMVLVDFLAFGPELLLIAFGFAPPSWLRSLRVFRLLKMARYIPAFSLVVDALRSCMQELLVSLSLSVVLWYLASVFLYLAESEAQPEKFGSIVRAMWWGVATLTTVGYGDVYPETALGKILAGVVAVIGLGAVALPSGIIAGAFMDRYRARREAKARVPRRA